MYDETHLCEVAAKRKGREQKPCTLKAGFINRISARQVVLRTEDVGGVSPLVAIMTPETARELGEALIQAANRFCPQP